MGIGLALAGGGLKGASYIGVFKALEELKIDIDYISGTSSGSIFAVMYAMGYSLDEIKDMFTRSFEEIIKIEKMPLMKQGMKYLMSKDFELEGVIDGKKIEDIVDEYAEKKGIKKFSDINKNLAIITVDAKSTKKCILWTKPEKIEENVDYISDISVGKAVRSSMAFPAAFTPCRFRDYIFIDGGTKDNLPIEVLKTMGAKKTLGLSFKLDKYKDDSNLFDTILRACDIFSYRDILKAQSQSDYFIEIDIARSKIT